MIELIPLTLAFVLLLLILILGAYTWYIIYTLSKDRSYRKQQDEVWDLYMHDHEINTLPGGYLIHSAYCWCKKEKNHD